MNALKRALALMVALLLALSAVSFADETVNEEVVPDIVASEPEMPGANDEPEPLPEEETVVVAEVEAPAVEKQDVMLDGSGEDEPAETNMPEFEENVEDSAEHIPFDQCVEIDDVSIRVLDNDRSFPEGAALRAERLSDDEITGVVDAALDLEQQYNHVLYRIEVYDAAENACISDTSRGIPIVYVQGLNVADDVRAAVYDALSKEVYVTDAVVENGVIAFPFVESAVYDILTPQVPEHPSEDVEPQAVVTPEDDIHDGPADGETPEVNDEIEEDQTEDQPNEAAENSGTAEKMSAGNEEGTAAEENIPAPVEATQTEDSKESSALYEGEAVQSAEQESEKMIAEAASYTPQTITITLTKNSKRTINSGDTLIISTSTAAISWSSSKTSVAGVSFDGEKATVTAYKPGKATITAKLSKKKRIALKLTVKDPYLPTSVSFANLSSVLTVGDTIDLNDCIAFEPAYATSKLTWKSSNKKIAKVGKNGVLTAVKAGKVKITVTTRNKKRRSVKITVVANGIFGLNSKPSKANATALGNAFSIWPKSVQYSGGNNKIVAEFYLLNGSKYKISRINGLSLNLYVGNRNNMVATQYFSKIKVNGERKGVSTFQATFSGSGVAQNNVHLTEYSAGNVYFDLDTSSVYAVAGKKTIPFVATAVPNVPSPTYATEIILSEKELSLDIGGTALLTARIQPEGAEESPAIHWTSSNDEIVFADSNGLIAARSEGSAVITASMSSQNGITYSAGCKVTVNPPTYRALLIGEGTFKEEDKYRRGYMKEVESLRNMLSSRKTASGTSWKIQTQYDRSADQIHKDIRNVLGSAKECDVSLFFIGTHGDMTRDYDDKKASRLACYKNESYITTKELASWLDEVPGKVIVFIESCGSGGFIAEKSAGSNVNKSASTFEATFDPDAFDQALTQAFMELDRVVPNSVNSSLMFAGDLRDHTTGFGENKFYVLTSSAFQEKSHAYSEGSYFAKWLVQGVGTSGDMKADTQYAGNRDGKVTLSELYTYISKVGDNKAFTGDGETQYQHVQVYPANSELVLFAK